jgi:hypothetical protein
MEHKRSGQQGAGRPPQATKPDAGRKRADVHEKDKEFGQPARQSPAGYPADRPPPRPAPGFGGQDFSSGSEEERSDRAAGRPVQIEEAPGKIPAEGAQTGPGGGARRGARTGESLGTSRTSP